MRNVSQAAHSAERSPLGERTRPSRVGDGALAVANFSGLSGSPFSTENLSLGEDGAWLPLPVSPVDSRVFARCA